MQTLETPDVKSEAIFKKHVDGWGKSLDSKLYLEIFELDQNNDSGNAQKIYQRLTIAMNNNIYIIFKGKRDQAILDEELTHVNEASDLHFITFLNSQPKLKTPAFFVNSFNNIELTWRKKEIGTVDIQFLEDGLLQYVLFSEEKTPDYGRDSVENVIQKIKDYGLWDLVYEPA
jgi:hypothetical protein